MDDVETRRRIEETVNGILRRADIDSMTELSVRAMASEELSLDLSDPASKTFIRTLIDSFLLSLHLPEEEDDDEDDKTTPDNGVSGPIPRHREPERVAAEEEDGKADVDLVGGGGDGGGGFTRVICELSKKRHVTVTGSKGDSVVSITEFYEKDGDRVPAYKGATLTSEQWSIFKKNIPAIEEAISTAKSRIRLKLEQGRTQGACIKSVMGNPQVLNLNSKDEIERQRAIRQNHVNTGKTLDQTTNMDSTPSGLAPVEIIRFNGTNYYRWLARIEPLLNQLKVAHVLVDPCPSPIGASKEDIGQLLAAAQKWMDNDYICRLNILNSLSDQLFDQYAGQSYTAKELLEELRVTFLNEEHGSKVSLVRKYVEFQMVEEKSIVDQVQEFHEIADSIIASGMFVEEKFHVNVIISKLPPSWKGLGVKLMKEEHLPVWLLMNHLKQEESSRGSGSTYGGPLMARMPEHQHPKNLGPHATMMKKPGILHSYHEPDKDQRLFKFCNICKKKGHLPEQCWFRKSGSHDQNSATPHVVADVDTDKLMK